MSDSTAHPSPTALHALSWAVKGKPAAVLVIAHGLAEHAARYANLAQAMNRIGVSVYAADHRGHGRTAKSQDELGFFAPVDGWALVLDDLDSVVTHAIASNRGAPVFLLGHSMGSILARCYAIEHSDRLAGLILTGTRSDPGLLGDIGMVTAKLIASVRGPKHRSAWLTRLTLSGYNRAFKPNRTKFDWLTRDQAVVDAYVADPLCGFTPTVGLYVDLLTGLQHASDPDHVALMRPSLPVLIASGEADPEAKHISSVETLFRAAGLREVRLKLYPGARHEIINETNRQEVFDDLTRWVKQHIR